MYYIPEPRSERYKSKQTDNIETKINKIEKIVSDIFVLNNKHITHNKQYIMQSQNNETYSVNDKLHKMETKIDKLEDILGKIISKMDIITSKIDQQDVTPEIIDAVNCNNVESNSEINILKKCNIKYCMGCSYGDYDDCEYKDMPLDITKKCSQCEQSYHIGYDYKQCVQCGTIYCDNCKTYYFLCAETCTNDP
jgi:hypothetical protein